MASIDLTRSRFSEGALLTAEDLTCEQNYVDRRLGHLGSLLGPGILQGLEVVADRDTLVVKPGFALDAHGQEIGLTTERRHSASAGVLCISRARPVPLKAADIAPTRPAGTRPSAVIAEVEQATLEILAPEAVDKQVRLALIACDADGGWVVTLMPHLRRVAAARIQYLSWTHAGQGPWPPRIEFSAPVQAPTRQLLEIRSAKSSSGLLPHDVKLELDGRCLVFSEEPRARPNDLIIVHLACDFILDRHGVPVCGPFGGAGAPGGLFESWFYVGQRASP